MFTHAAVKEIARVALSAGYGARGSSGDRVDRRGGSCSMLRRYVIPNWSVGVERRCCKPNT